jgi:putative hydrolase of the HAD superfamily
MADRPVAVLLDVGGIFHLPSHERVLGAYARGGFTARAEDLDPAHYRGATCFTTDYEGEMPWRELWRAYLVEYARACGVGDDMYNDVHEHLDSEFATAGLWSRIIPGSVGGLRTLAATGVTLGVVSNADGSVAARLREQEVLQVGPGIGVEVGCVIDSGEVGINKPDPRIFTIALDALGVEPHEAWYLGDMPGIDVVGARAAGLRPFIIDPYGLHDGASYDTVPSLEALASLAGG